jgi:predicted oxidoreductase
MMTQTLKGTDYTVSRLVMGCMRTGGAWNDSDPEREVIDKALRLFEAALGAGINHFDHADIYGRGRAEKVFSHVWTGGLARREDLIVQSKCGIRFPGDPDASCPARPPASSSHGKNGMRCLPAPGARPYPEPGRPRGSLLPGGWI